ncbi:uncharacterized protein N7459_006078 [Penicillium hispanicum]|uniref:uncharacterized protein n=1 Tax=Penicillium hispanicum TaxID=1080232 RepID=UPI0025407A5C|nr:uncharacterized protein N7459_006078 [Penicillium hispanicum]KAJ5580093.1 hypothetical protein N7459_006078 [Penicillium hispanicum]
MPLLTISRCHGILDQLRPDEWREVKYRTADKTFQCDLLGKLPLEIVALIAEHMDLADVVLLQRVSRRWQRVLSSPPVLGVAVRAVSGKEVPVSGFTSAIKKRLRMERGQPTAKVSLPSPLSAVHDTLMNLRGVGYSDGIYAWLEGSDGRTSITLLHLWSGRLTRLTTENREQLAELRISKQLVAAVSTRGYCHAWDLNTQEHQSFRLSSLKFQHFIVHGLKIALSYRDYIVQWGFDTQIARTVQVGDCIFVLALHPVEDQFTVVRFCRQYSHDAPDSDDDFPGNLPPVHRLHTEKYALVGSNRFRSIFSQDQLFPLVELDGWSDQILALAQDLSDGQSSVIVRRRRTRSEESEWGTWSHAMLYLALEGDQVTVHSLPFLPNISTLAHLEQGLIYAPTQSTHELMILGIEKTSTSFIPIPTDSPASPSTPSQTSFYRHMVLREVPFMDCHLIFGDSDFVIMVNLDEVEIWCFDENWEPSCIQPVF